MSLNKVADVNVVSSELLPTPREVKNHAPLSEQAESFIFESRNTLNKILNREDKRLAIVVGPCSIHDIEAAQEYADKLKELQKKVEKNLFLVMRVYFSKPRTTIGWKGLINDPHLDDSFKVNQGLMIARKFLLDLAEKGIPVGTEVLDAITPQYLDDLITWSAIGARTAESQSHREMASGLSTPVGIKNGTDGNVNVAINALKTMLHPHRFLGINQEGQCVVIHTNGNKHGQLILRGGGGTPNFDAESVRLANEALKKANLAQNIIIDCSHGNSNKDYRNQPAVLDSIIKQRLAGDDSIVGVMLESNINEGRQDLKGDKSNLEYGVSITDSCINWEKTEELLLDAEKRLS